MFHVIPAELVPEGFNPGAGIQSRTERDFSRLQILWTPVFTGETNRRQFSHTFPLGRVNHTNCLCSEPVPELARHYDPVEVNVGL